LSSPCVSCVDSASMAIGSGSSVSVGWVCWKLWRFASCTGELVVSRGSPQGR
jgi:hypothetical protein